jgi:hypothetical protein
MKSISKTVMPQIMANSSNKKSHHVNMI